MLKVNCFVFLAVLLCAENGAHAAQTTVLTKGQQLHSPVLPIENQIPYNASKDAKDLYDALIGIGTNDQVVVGIITNRTNAQRQHIIESYKHLYEKDLIEDLKDDLSGQFEKIIIALMRKPYQFLAKELHRALTSIVSSDDHVVAEILCTRSKNELIPIEQEYLKLYNTSLNEDIETFTEGDFKLFLHNILTSHQKMRKESEFNPHLSLMEHITDIVPNREQDCGPQHNPKLDETFARESFDFIQYFVELYEQNKKKTVVSSLQRWCTDQTLLDAYVTVVEYAQHPAKFYAKQIYNAVMGLGTNDNTIVRIITSRSEIDLKNIKKAYQELYQTTLASSISKETSGYYRESLLSIINYH